MKCSKMFELVGLGLSPTTLWHLHVADIWPIWMNDKRTMGVHAFLFMRFIDVNLSTISPPKGDKGFNPIDILQIEIPQDLKKEPESPQ